MTLTNSVADAASVRAAYERLRVATRTGSPCDPIRDLIGDSDISAGYAVQVLFRDDALAAGRVRSGRKIGLTSPAVQNQLGVDQPDFGQLFADMACAEDERISASRVLQPRIEAEVAFVLAADILGDESDMTAKSVRPAVAHAVAALEIVGSRVRGWDIRITDTVADNASSGLYVLGSTPVPIADVEPRDVAMALYRDGEAVSEGNGRACLGDPLNALAWLARAAARYGDPLRAGEVILSGALGPMVPVEAGASYRAEVSGLGTVQATFTA
jgi:2-keto-4-pentenoate hydratase